MKDKHHQTVDEKYMLCLYEQAEKSGEMDKPFNRYDIGTLIAIHPRGVDATCKLLLRTNFIKKSGEVDIYLTPHGENLARALREEYGI